jgi:spore coat polysaccharide biosynthesis protein SpsF
VIDSTIKKTVSTLLNDPVRRREMRAAGLMTIDGQGAARVAADLAGTLAERRAAKPLQTAL